MFIKKLSVLLLAGVIILFLHSCSGISRSESTLGSSSEETVSAREIDRFVETDTAPSLSKTEADGGQVPSRSIATEPFAEVRTPELLARVEGSGP